MYNPIWQAPAHFLSTQMAVMTSFFQLFILLGKYNFAGNLDLKLIFSYDGAHVKKLRAAALRREKFKFKMLLLA